MSDLAPEFRRRLRFTPARDLVRGRISGRLDLMATIARSGLPTQAQDLIRRVVKRTRLWMLEKVVVADELIAHFNDGLENGSSIQALIEKFGNERQAAKLIRRAKKRNRPLPWHIMRALGWMLVILLTIYGFLAVRFILGRASPKVNYVALMNQPRLSVPEAQRAWPLYRQALLQFGEREKKEAVDRLNQVFDARPGGPDWEKVGPWLTAHQKVIELARAGAQRPIVGFILGRHGSIDDPQLYPGLAQSMSPEEGFVVAILLPHLSDLRLLASALVTDARFARQQGDAARVIGDIEALLKMSQQVHRDSGFVVVDLVALSIWEIGMQTVEDALLDEKLKLKDADSQKLAHLLSKPKVAADLVSFAGERMMVLDVIQRCYTDDGDGDGHLTMQGEKLLRYIGAVNGNGASGYFGAVGEGLTWAARPALADGRAQTLRKYEQMMDLADANLRRPLREANWKEYELSREHVDRVRRPVLGLAASLANCQNRAEIFLGHRDGIVTAIALELYRRKQGDYPNRPEALVPEYLPQIPADRITGEPVKFKLHNGKPLIYSVGADRDDDGGKPPPGNNGWFHVADWSVSKQQATDGDWLLFPQRSGEENH
ncbi:MAG TPA: hypothetical protein VGP99_13615 [Tepidisphaeraceae bacterium]|jgi:hypothetical protein|nr:hypothetical protein [Tepidisphaeraceae bacterium]